MGVNAISDRLAGFSTGWRLSTDPGTHRPPIYIFVWIGELPLASSANSFNISPLFGTTKIYGIKASTAVFVNSSVQKIFFRPTNLTDLASPVAPNYKWL
jgi:hypothetical protein